MAPKNKFTIFTDPQAVASVLLLVFVDEWGAAPLLGDDDARWAPETVLRMLQLHAGKVPEQNFNKLMAAVQVMTTNDFERSLPDFIRLCNLLADSPTDDGFDPAETHEIAWALVEAALLGDNLEPDGANFNPEIQAYVVHMASDEGLSRIPPPLTLAVPQDQQDLQMGFTDDPLMFGATMGIGEGRESEIAEFVTQRVQLLLQQIESLALSNRVAEWKANIAKMLQRLLHAGTPSEL